MPQQGVVEYVRELRMLGLNSFPMTLMFTETMKHHTKHYNHEVVVELAKLMKDRDNMGEADWLLDALIPYGPDWLLDDFEDELGRSELIYVYDTALGVSQERLSHIIDHVTKYQSYEEQLRSYVDYADNGYESDNYGVIVMMLADKAGKTLTDLDYTEETFQTWKLNVVNNQV